ncbi:MAG: alpha/beta fold hydrolase [Pseudomonadota bacterium]
MAEKKPVNTRDFAHLYPFKSNFLEVNGFKYHYLDEGRGDAVIAIHGNPTWSFYYRSLVKELSSDYRVIAPDHIGCGLSDKPGDDLYHYRLQSRVDDLEALIDHLGLTNGLTLVVHDWGGAIGFALALRRPESISRLIILNTAAFFPPQKKGIPFRLRLVRSVMPFAVPAVLGLNLFARGAVYMAAKKKLPRDVRAGLLAPYNSWNNRRATLRFVQDIPLKPGDASYDLVKSVADNLHLFQNRPILICWGMRDFVFDAWYLQEWRRRFPQAEVHEFAAAGHYVLEDASEEIVRLTRDFLTRHPLESRLLKHPEP